MAQMYVGTIDDITSLMEKIQKFAMGSAMIGEKKIIMPLTPDESGLVYHALDNYRGYLKKIGEKE